MKNITALLVTLVLLSGCKKQSPDDFGGTLFEIFEYGDINMYAEEILLSEKEHYNIFDMKAHPYAYEQYLVSTGYIANNVLMLGERLTNETGKQIPDMRYISTSVDYLDWKNNKKLLNSYKMNKEYDIIQTIEFTYYDSFEEKESVFSFPSQLILIRGKWKVLITPQIIHNEEKGKYSLLPEELRPDNFPKTKEIREFMRLDHILGSKNFAKYYELQYKKDNSEDNFIKWQLAKIYFSFNIGELKGKFGHLLTELKPEKKVKERLNEYVVDILLTKIAYSYKYYENFPKSEDLATLINGVNKNYSKGIAEYYKAIAMQQFYRLKQFELWKNLNVARVYDKEVFNNACNELVSISLERSNDKYKVAGQYKMYEPVNVFSELRKRYNWPLGRDAAIVFFKKALGQQLYENDRSQCKKYLDKAIEIDPTLINDEEYSQKYNKLISYLSSKDKAG
ncbi:MAG: hypothetical protein K8S16_08435 [Bacteroidales bacterium]|nr:hypothetical protein [Bacteroidales bacterium]